MSDTKIFEVRRQYLTDKSTIGILSIDGVFQCYTLEPQKTPSGTSKGCIPAGEYRLGIRFSNRFQRLMPALYDVPGFDGILIHKGNFPQNTQGCILVGQRRDPNPDTIAQSGLAWDDLMMKICEACEWGPQTIKIFDYEPLKETTA